MKRTLAALTLALTGSVAAFGQVVLPGEITPDTRLVAGWDWDIGTTITGTIPALYSDMTADGPAAATQGTMYINNTNGAGLWDITVPQAGPSATLPVTADSSQPRLTPGNLLGDFGGVGNPPRSLGLFSTNTTVTRAFSFVLNTTGIDSLLGVNYRTSTLGATATASIDWSLIVGSTTYNLDPAIAVAGTNGVFTTQGFHFTGVDLLGATSVTLVGAVAGLAPAAQAMLLDNLAVYGEVGTVIPEPGTYAALLALGTLSIVGVRRFRQRNVLV